MFLAFHLDNYPYQASLLLPNFQAIGRLPALLLFCSFSHQQVNNSNPITPHSGVGIPTSYLYNCCWCSCFVSLLPYCVCLSLVPVSLIPPYPSPGCHSIHSYPLPSLDTARETQDETVSGPEELRTSVEARPAAAADFLSSFLTRP